MYTGVEVAGAGTSSETDAHAMEREEKTRVRFGY